MAHFRFSHPSTPRVRIIQVAPPRKGPSTSAGQGRPHSNKPAGQPGRAGSAAPTPPPHSRSSGHGTHHHHSVRHTQLHNITTAAPNNTLEMVGIITTVISPLSVSRGSSLAWLVSRGQAGGGIRRSHPQQSQEQASRQAGAAAPSSGSSREPQHQPPGRAASNAPPPEGGRLDSERLFSKKGVRTQAGMGAKMTPTPTLAASSHSNLNVTPRPTPRPRHEQPAALIEQQAPLADVMGPTRRSLAPTATICPYPPKKSQSSPTTPV
jgi:hypothetical protein